MSEKFSWNRISQIGVPKQHKKSIPLHNDEMVMVDGLAMCYRLNRDGEYVVVMPGGINVLMKHLIERGHKVTPPQRKRVLDFA